MGFFKKLGKKMRGFFKRIGKGIKKGFAKFGKFMGKIGILGQIAMMFILPGIGSAMLKGLGSITGISAAGTASAAAGASASAAASAAGASAAGASASGFVASAAAGSSVIAKGVAWTLKTAQRFANSPLLKPFKTVTDAVSGFMENTAKFVGNKVGLGKIKPGSKFANYFNDAPAEFFGKGDTTVLGRVGKSVTDNWSSFKDDIAAGDIFMSGDKDLSFTKAYDSGLAEKTKPNSFSNYKGQASIDGVPVDEMFAMNTTNNKLDPLLENLADTRANISASDKIDFTNANNFDPLEVINSKLEGITRTTPKEGFFDKMGENLKEKFITGEDSFAQNLRPVNMLGNIGESIVKAPANMVSQSLLAPLMGGGRQQASGWYSNAGPTYNPGRDRAEQYAYSTAMSSADATSQVFGSDYDYFTASQADQYGVDAGGTWGNYMGNQRVA